MEFIGTIVAKFFDVANALFVILGIDKELKVDEEISAKISEWYDIVVNGK